ncbi:glycine zipper family protein [Helicobacter pylori]|uniref:glycine zipper family protein n=1 Tax=Helicobacter pylori TaxID=210 RepID=UPI00165B4186|nr:glycine zipper family protein [Helicobacter pylori]MBH0252817.1 glycine zipper family protein [Helicobacter pylori]
MPLPFILAGVALAAAGYGVKKGIDALDADCEADEFIKKAESLKEEATKKAESAESDCRRAFMRLGEKKLHVLSHTVSNFLDHFHRLNRSRIIIEGINIQDIQGQVSDARKITNQYREMDFFDVSGAVAGSTIGGVLAAYGTYTGISMAAAGSMALIGGVGAAPVIAILGAISADEMEKKLENAKAYCSQAEAAVKKADVVIDNFRSVEKMAELFTRQITKFDALFFSLAQDAIATMKKHNYNVSRYNQKEKDQLCVTVSTLMTLSAFLKVSIMDESQKLTEKTKNVLNLMRKQMDSLENGNYSLRGIRFRQAQLEDLRDDKIS